jgi:hypothetical protein
MHTLQSKLQNGLLWVPTVTGNVSKQHGKGFTDLSFSRAYQVTDNESWKDYKMVLKRLDLVGFRL